MDQQGRTRRFNDLVWPHRADTLRVAQFLCHDAVLAQDLAQETLLKAFAAIERVVEGPRIKAWLLRILRNTWLDRLRAASGRPAELSLAELVEESDFEPAASPETGEIRTSGDPHAVLEAFSDEKVIEALQALPEEIRWTLLLVDVEGLSLQEAAQVLQVPAGTIKSRCHRGRKMLYEKLLPLARELRLVSDDGKESSSRTEGSHE